MPVVSQVIPNFYQGISQQVPTQRYINQGEEQINFQNDIVRGLTKRPPMEYIKTLETTIFSNKIKTWSIQRDENNLYLCAFYNEGVKVYDLSGNEKTVSFPDGTTYLASTNPKSDFNMVNIADYTFVANKSITPTADTSTSAAKVEEFLIYVKTTNYGREYSVTINHPDMTRELKVIFQMPDGAVATTDSAFRDSSKIADILLNGTSSTHWDASASGIAFKTIRTDTGANVSTTQGLANLTDISSHFTWGNYESVIYGKPTDGDSGYTLSSSDGAGHTSMYIIRDKIQDFTKLPYHGKLNVIMKITGDEGDTLSDYYVKFDGDGVWTETIAPATSVGLTDTTMPHALVNNNDGTFTFQKITWEDRVCGDTDTNPNPSFVGKAIQNMTFYKNRLGILSGENLILSGNADFYNFFSTTVTQVLDTDVIDISASGTQVNTLKNSIGFNETLLLFSDTAQYKLAGAGDVISPTTAIINEVSSFEHDDSVAPVSAGRYAYFCQKRNENTGVREYYADDETLTNDGVDVTAAVQSLIPANAYNIISNTTEDTLLVFCADTADSGTGTSTITTPLTVTNAGTMYVYKYFFEGGDKVQNAWSKWTFAGVKILGGMAHESYVYLLTCEDTDTKLMKLDLRNLKDSTIGFNPHIDLRESKTGVYASGTGLTTVTPTYAGKEGLIAVDKTNGTNYALTDAANATCTITVTDALNIAVGTTLTLTDNAGVSTTMTGTATNPTTNPNEFSVGVDAASTADNIAVGASSLYGINGLAGYSAPNPASNVITVTRAVAGASNLTVTSSDPVRLAVTNFVTPATSFTLVGNHTDLYVGIPYESQYTLSTQYLRQTKGRAEVAITTGRYQIRQITLDYQDSGFFKVEVTPNNRDTFTKEMNGYVIGTSESTIDAPAITSGTINIPIQCRNTRFVFDIKSSSHLPVQIASADIEGYYHSRSTRV